MKRTVLAGVMACVVWGGSTCYAGEHGFEGQQCEVFEHCTAEQINAACAAHATTTTTEPDFRDVTVTTTTLPPSSVDGGFPTPCQGQPVVKVCRWTKKNGQRFKHCTVTGSLTAQCGGGSVRRDGSVVFGPRCVVREQ